MPPKKSKGGHGHSATGAHMKEATIDANLDTNKRLNTDDPDHGPSTKKTKVHNDSPDTPDGALESDPPASSNPAKDTPPVPADGENPAMENIVTTSKSEVEPPPVSTPLVGIRYFEHCLSWIVDLDYDSFRFVGKNRPKLMEHYTNPEGREVKQDAKVLIQGFLDTSGFFSLDETNRFEDNPKSKEHYGCRLYLMDKEAEAVRRLYEAGPMTEDVKGSISLKQDVETLARVSTRPDWDVRTDGFPFLYEGSLYAGGLTGPPLMPDDFHTGDLVVAEFTLQGYSFNGREGYTLGLCSLYKIESGTGSLPAEVTDGANQDTLFAAETPRRMRAPRPVF